MRAMNLTIIMYLMSLFTIISCSTRPKIESYSKTSNPKEEITKLEVDLQNSDKQNIDLLSHFSFSEANIALKNAIKYENENKPKEKVLKELALGHAYLDQAKRKASENAIILQDVLIARDNAIKQGAKKYFSTDLGEIDKEVKAKTYKNETRKFNLNEVKENFLASYLNLELRSIKKRHLAESEFYINKAINNGARELAPRTLLGVNKKLEDTEYFISQNRYNEKEIEKKSFELLTSARELAEVTELSKELSTLSKEEMALKVIEENKKLAHTEEELSEEQDVNMALAQRNRALNQEQELNHIYEATRKKFSENEADVLLDGKNLVIRLKALSFPTSKAILTSENFIVLKKVENVLNEFGDSKVIVEGHTDSTGSKNFNQKLSEKRADAVMDYLRINTQDNHIHFMSKGLGDQQPIETNKTVVGRAHNRRVDIIIEPIQIQAEEHHGHR